MFNAIMDALFSGEDPEKGKKAKPTGDEKTEKWLALKKKYGGQWLDKRMEWLDWADKKLPSGVSPKELALKYAKKYNLDPEYILSSAMEEGIGNRWEKTDKATGQKYLEDWSTAYENANKNGELNGYDVDGFRTYGLDTIGDRLPSLVKGGYLDQAYAQKFKPYKAQNELKQWITTGAFKDDDSAFQAKAAIMAQERDAFDKFVAKRGIKLSPDAQKFFMLAAYNGGAGKAQAMLDHYAKRGLLTNDAFLQSKPAGDPNGQIYSNVMPRLYGGKLYRGEGYLDEPKVIVAPPAAPPSAVMGAAQ